ncbi:hypothetical protein P7C71_g4548, partial [Lecanoromycetidae sp. Uapishka_2]
MLDPLTAISLASSVIQFTDFGIKLVTESIDLYRSVDRANAETSALEVKITHIRTLADQVIFPLKGKDDDTPASKNEEHLRELAESCKALASDLLAVLDGLKVKKSPGPGRKLESLRKAVEAQIPWNKEKIASLEKKLYGLQNQMFRQIELMMR